MSTLIVKNLSYSYGKDLFKNISFTISAQDRIGLVGINGSGKSSLLKCLTGVYEPDSGRIEGPGKNKLAYVEQDLPQADAKQSVRDYIGARVLKDEKYKVDMLLEMAEMPPAVRDLKLRELSGGWQRICMILSAYASDPALILLDEPTNHLDQERILWLEQFITAQNVPFIVISHDRKLLDNVCNKTFFLRGGKFHIFSAPFSRARKELERLDQAAEHQNAQDLKKAKQLTKTAAEIRQDNFRCIPTLQRRARLLEEKAERIKDKAAEMYRPDRRDLVLTENEIRAKSLLRLENVDVATPDGRLLFHINRLMVHRGDRVVLLGENGSGKTTLIRLLQRAIAQATNGVIFNPQVRPMFFDQHLSDLPPGEGLKDYMRRIVSDLPEEKIIHELVAAGFPYKSQMLKIGNLSLGERMRLKFLELKLAAPTFFFLDEPTNHLDIEGIEKLESELLKTQTAAIIVSHDRTLINNVATVFWQIDPKKKTIEVMAR